MKLVITCAGKGTRMKSHVPKVLHTINGRTLLGHITYQWSDVVDSYVLVVSPQNERQIRGALKGVKNVEYVVQPAPSGLANAIYQAKKAIKDDFIVNLGDCLFQGEFVDLPKGNLGIGVWETYDLDEINKSYLVGVSPASRLVEDVIEKPNTTCPHGNCGMGVYFLDERIFGYIKKYDGPNGGGDFTAVIQSMIDANEKISPVDFKGKYININSSNDLRKAEEIFK